MRCAYCALLVALGFGCKDKLEEALPASRATLIAATEPQRVEPAPVPAAAPEPQPVRSAPAADGGQANPDAGPRVMDARLAMPQSTRSPCGYGYRLAAAGSCMPSLVRLELTAGGLRPTFTNAVTQYDATLPLSSQTVDLLLTAGLSAKVNVNGRPVEHGRWQSPLLPLGQSHWSIQVDEANFPSTEYALNIQRGEEHTLLQPDKPAPMLRFGNALALSGDTLAVGVPGDGVDLARSGGVVVYVRGENGWRRQATLKANNAESGDEFGASLALSGDTLVVGASGEDGADNLAAESGAVYVFARKGASWREQAYLKASNAVAGDRFGASVAISDQTLVVGATGAAYVFARRDQRWTQQTRLKSDAASDFGQAVAIDHDLIAVSAGASACVFARRGVSWSQEARLKPASAEARARSVAISGNTCAIGAAADSGMVYVFTRSGAAWQPEAQLKPSDAHAREAFGQSLALEADRLVVGAGASGAAYLFTRADAAGSAWSQATSLAAVHSTPEAQYGYAVSVSSSAIAIGAPGESSQAGSAYVVR